MKTDEGIIITSLDGVVLEGLRRKIVALAEENTALHATVRAQKETIGELLALMPHVVEIRKMDWPPK